MLNHIKKGLINTYIFKIFVNAQHILNIIDTKFASCFTFPLKLVFTKNKSKAKNLFFKKRKKKTLNKKKTY